LVPEVINFCWFSFMILVPVVIDFGSCGYRFWFMWLSILVPVVHDFADLVPDFGILVINLVIVCRFDNRFWYRFL